MDLLTYYAKYGPKGRGTAGPNSSSEEAKAANEIGSTQDTHSLTIEEDDSRQITHHELLALMHDLRFPGSLRQDIHQFNEANATLVSFQSTSALARLARRGKLIVRMGESTRVRCNLCASKKVVCSRAREFNQWMVRHKFSLSWKKAEEVLERGLKLYREDSRARQGSDIPFAPQTPVKTGERTSPRKPVPRVRKAPTAILAPDREPEVRQRPKKRRLAGPPRSDRKRRKTPDSESEADHKPTKLELDRGQKHASLPTKHQVIRLLAPQPQEGISARLTAMEQRLDAIESQAPKFSGATKHRLENELDLAISEVAADSKAGVERLRALRAWLTQHDDWSDEDDDDDAPFALGPCWAPSNGFLLDEDSTVPQDYSLHVSQDSQGSRESALDKTPAEGVNAAM
ncbi:hypothetical protein C8J57DRAFT_1365536 [Mycena rebaudengoi]|nr:hypothetical protein C8J57DRAFT_1365536 [Mycena rebaudengoi]